MNRYVVFSSNSYKNMSASLWRNCSDNYDVLVEDFALNLLPRDGISQIFCMKSVDSDGTGK